MGLSGTLSLAFSRIPTEAASGVAINLGDNIQTQLNILDFTMGQNVQIFSFSKLVEFLPCRHMQVTTGEINYTANENHCLQLN